MGRYLYIFTAKQADSVIPRNHHELKVTKGTQWVMANRITDLGHLQGNHFF